MESKVRRKTGKYIFAINPNLQLENFSGFREKDLLIHLRPSRGVPYAGSKRCFFNKAAQKESDILDGFQIDVFGLASYVYANAYAYR